MKWSQSTCLSWSETKTVKNQIIDNFFCHYLMVIKLCTVIEVATYSENWCFWNCCHFHGNYLTKLTKRCLKVSFLSNLKYK